MTAVEVERFLKKIRKEGDCLIWTGAKMTSGYGIFVVAGRQTGAHRAAYQHWVGKVESGSDLHHKCNHRDCVNHLHLIPATRKYHMKFLTKWTLKTHCNHGHEYTTENTYTYFNPKTEKNHRMCRICKAHKDRQRRLRMKRSRKKNISLVMPV